MTQHKKETTIVSTGFGSVRQESQGETRDSKTISGWFDDLVKKFNKNTNSNKYKSHACKSRRRESIHSVVIMTKLQNFSRFITKINLMIHSTLLIVWVHCG